MKWNRKTLERKAGALAFALAQRRFARMDPLRAERAGERLGMLVFHLSRKHRRRTFSNLELAMPELSEAERDRIARGVFKHFGIVAADFFRSRSRTAEEMLASIVETSGVEHIEAACAEGKGAMVVTGHFGNWERLGQFCATLGRPLHVVARDANDPGLNALVAELRESAGLKVLSRGNAVRAILTALRRNDLVGILPDQNAEDLFVPFFGLMAGTVQGPGVIHQRTGAPVIPGFCVRVGPGQYRIEVHPPLQLPEGCEDPVKGMTQAINDTLEAMIRRYPEQWLWMHDRWKYARWRKLL